MSLSPPPSGNILIYDEECFFCSNYVRLLNLRKSIDGIEFVNGRDRQAVEALHFDPRQLNEGIILILGDKQYFGADAIHRLALLSTSSTLFNKMNRTIFRTQWVAWLLYPLLKLGRAIYLALSGKGQIK